MTSPKTAFILHGSYGNPQENWFQWLKLELEKIGYQVFVPEFPIPSKENQNPAYTGHSLQDWTKTLDQYSQYINENTTFVAHSRGCVFLYHYLAKLDKPVAATFLVAPWINYRWYTPEFSEVDSFHLTPFDWEKIKNNSHQFVVFQSTNDDTPISEGQEISGKINAELVNVDNAGHFNTRSGYTTFPLLLEKIKSKIISP